MYCRATFDGCKSNAKTVHGGGEGSQRVLFLGPSPGQYDQF